jgi:hypothetical protein
MINIWGICEFAEISHDPLRRWDFCCNAFSPREDKRIEGERYCANCHYWLACDENLEVKKT